MTADTAESPHTAQSLSGRTFAGRDRVLLYTRGMEIDPIAGVDLALESLKRAGDSSPPSEVMGKLYEILDEKNYSFILKNSDGSHLKSVLPINRRHVIANDMAKFSFSAALFSYFRNIFMKTRKKSERGA